MVTVDTNLGMDESEVPWLECFVCVMCKISDVSLSHAIVNDMSK